MSTIAEDIIDDMQLEVMELKAENARLREALDLAAAIADAIAEGRHSAAVVKWDQCRDEWRAILERPCAA